MHVVASAGSGPTDGQEDSIRDGDDGAAPSLEGQDWREVRAMLQAGGMSALEERRQILNRPGFHAFPLSFPEVGCFLASHPAFYRRNHMYLTQSVVFVTQHDEAGSTGLVVNRPLSGDVRSIEEAGVLGRALDLSSTPLASSPVYLGGPDSLGADAPLAVIHDSGDGVEGAREPLTGVLVSPLDNIIESVVSGALDPAKVRLMSGCLKWGPGKLIEAVENGEWFAASASKEFALSHCVGLPTPLWKELMLVMSPLHEQIARQVYKDDDVK